MKTFILDSYALLAYLEKEPGWRDVATLFAQVASGEAALLFCSVNWGEVFYIVEREYGTQKAREVVDLIDRLPIELVDADREVALQAASLKAKGGIAYADCFAAGLALMRDGEVVTGDPEFEVVESDISVYWLPDDNSIE